MTVQFCARLCNSVHDYAKPGVKTRTSRRLLCRPTVEETMVEPPHVSVPPALQDLVDDLRQEIHMRTRFPREVPNLEALVGMCYGVCVVPFVYLWEDGRWTNVEIPW